MVGVAGPALALAACLPAPPPSPAPPEVSATAKAVPTAALLDPYVGRYSSGGEQLMVRRSGDQLVVERAAAGAVALSLVGLGAFTDAHGATYLFAPASGKVATRLTLVAANGTRRDWTR